MRISFFSFSPMKSSLTNSSTTLSGTPYFDSKNFILSKKKVSLWRTMGLFWEPMSLFICASGSGKAAFANWYVCTSGMKMPPHGQSPISFIKSRSDETTPLFLSVLEISEIFLP